MTDIKYLIIPDVHGRDFWITPVNEVLENTNAKIIFLGDYLDVYIDDFAEKYNLNLNYYDSNYYNKENVAKIHQVCDDAVSKFESIIDVKKKYPDRVILLLGNHDCGYAIDRGICDVRRDRRNSKKIEELFETNKDMFQLADEAYISDKHFIFSHAGINKLYAKDCFGDSVNEDNVVTLFNDAFKNDNYGVMQSLGYYSRYRGRFGGDYGSLIWADAREWLLEGFDAYGYSIVGHTHFEQEVITDKMAFLDSKTCFYINSNGVINKYEQ